MNCDVLFHPQMLSDLVTSRHEDALLIAYQDDDAEPFGDEEMKVKVRRGRVVDIAKTLSPDEADGENVGIVKFGARRRAAAGGLARPARHRRRPARLGAEGVRRLRARAAAAHRRHTRLSVDRDRFPGGLRARRARRSCRPSRHDVAIAGDGGRRQSNTTVIEQPDATIVVRGVRLRPGSGSMPLSPLRGSNGEHHVRTLLSTSRASLRADAGPGLPLSEPRAQGGARATSATASRATPASSSSPARSAPARRRCCRRCCAAWTARRRSRGS